MIRAFRKLMADSPGGWYSASQIQASIAADLNLPKAHSTVRETWRFGKKSLLAKIYLGVRTFQPPRGPEIRYYLRYIDGRISVPADQYIQLTQAERDRLFPPRKRTEAEERESRKEFGKMLSGGISFLTKLALASESTEHLENELLERLRWPATEANAPFSAELPDLRKAHVEFRRPPSMEFALAIQAGLKGSGAPPSSRSAAPRTPSRRRATSGLPRRRKPSLIASEKPRVS